MTTEAPAEKTLLHITVSSQNYEDVVFKVKPTTKFEKIIEKYCERFNITNKNAILFLFDGEKLSKDSTPEDTRLEEGDVVEAVQEQVGGN